MGALNVLMPCIVYGCPGCAGCLGFSMGALWVPYGCCGCLAQAGWQVRALLAGVCGWLWDGFALPVGVGLGRTLLCLGCCVPPLGRQVE